MGKRTVDLQLGIVQKKSLEIYLGMVIKNIVVRVEREDSNRTFTQEEKYQLVKSGE